MTKSIPASQIVQINPSVVSGGGNPLVFNGVVLTESTAVPIGSVMPFASKDDVSAFFGPSAVETAIASVYFRGRDNATVLPQSLLFYQYNTAAVSAYTRGGSVASLTLAQLQAFSGTLTVDIDGVTATSGTINLATATSFSDAATEIEAGFTSPNFTVTYDSQRTAYVITSNSTGATSTVAYSSGTLATDLNLTQATGAVLSQGAAAATPSTAMDGVKSATLNWVGFMTSFEPVVADRVSFAQWTNNQNKRFVFAEWDTDAGAIQANDTTSFGAQVKTLGYDGSVPFYGDYTHAAFILGTIASIDFTRHEGRITFAFKSLSGLVESVNDETIANNLIANGYNYYGQYATANQGFTFCYPGSVSGKYLYLDELINEIWLNNQIQLAIMTFLTTVNSVPYNAQGYAMVDQVCLDPINAAIDFGAIRGGVPLSSAQATEVNTAAGVDISNVLASRGWYLQVLAATAQARSNRQSPPITLWYMDGGSIQKITLASIVVQ